MEKEILTLNEVIELTGLSRGTIYVLNYKKEIPCFKFGPKLLRFRRSEILPWMEKRNYMPLKDIISTRHALNENISEKCSIKTSLFNFHPENKKNTVLKAEHKKFSGSTFNAVTLIKAAMKNRKPVLIFYKNELIGKFDSIISASMTSGINENTLRKALRAKRSTKDGLRIVYDPMY